MTSAYRRRYQSKGCEKCARLIERNRAEGRAEGRAELIINMLKNQMKPEQIAKIADMTVEQVVSIGKKVAVL